MTTPKYKPPEKSIKKQTSNAFLFTHSKKLINRTCTIFSFPIVSKCGEQKKKKNNPTSSNSYIQASVHPV